MNREHYFLAFHLFYPSGFVETRLSLLLSVVFLFLRISRPQCYPINCLVTQNLPASTKLTHNSGTFYCYFPPMLFSLWVSIRWLRKNWEGEMRLLITISDEMVQFTSNSLKYGGANDKEIILVDIKYWHNSHTNHIQYLSKPAACLLLGAMQLLLLRFDEQSPLYSSSINGLVNKLAGFCSRQRGIFRSEAFQMDWTWVVWLYTSPVTLLTVFWFQKCHWMLL